MSNFTEYKERKEVVEAFQYDANGLHTEEIIAVFGGDEKNYNIAVHDGMWTVEFERPKKAEPAPAVIDASFAYVTFGNISSSTSRFTKPIKVTEGDWIVKRHLDTDPETVVMKDKDFRRKFRVS